MSGRVRGVGRVVLGPGIAEPADERDEDEDRAADDNADREVDDVAAEDELPESLDHCGPFVMERQLAAVAVLVEVLDPDDELELERDMEYFVEPDEAMAPKLVEPAGE